MPVIVVPKGQVAGEHRVALVPDVARRLKALGAEIRIEKDMGGSAFFHDEDYGDDVSLAQDSEALYDKADIVLSVQATLEDVEKMPDGCILIGFMAAHKQPELVKKLQQKKLLPWQWNWYRVFPVRRRLMPCHHRPLLPVIKRY